MLFQDPDFQKLLLLHSRDRRCQKLIEDLKELPSDLARMDKNIAIEKESVELALSEWKGLESQNNSLEKDILSMNELIAKQRNRQLEVKKNDEYQALENEVTNLEAKIEEKENEQIEVLLKIDGARETAEIAQGKITERVAEMQSLRDKTESQGEEKRVEIEALKLEIEERKDIEPVFISAYDRISKIVSRPPTWPQSKIKSAQAASEFLMMWSLQSSWKKITQCDQCGRIVYVER